MRRQTITFHPGRVISFLWWRDPWALIIWVWKYRHKYKFALMACKELWVLLSSFVIQRMGWSLTTYTKQHRAEQQVHFGHCIKDGGSELRIPQTSTEYFKPINYVYGKAPTCWKSSSSILLKNLKKQLPVPLKTTWPSKLGGILSHSLKYLWQIYR